MSSSATPPEERAALKKKIAAGPFGRKSRPDTRFPAPRFTTLKERDKKYFFEYWKSIPVDLQELAEVRIYRTWPLVKFELAEPGRRDKVLKQINGPCPFDPENWELELMMRDDCGSGSYRLDLKETGTDGIILTAYVDVRDMQRFPPVLDYSTLVNCPANQDYIRDCMRRNIKLPWEYSPEEENEMAGSSAEAVNTMAKAVTDIAKTAVESAHAAADAKVEAAEARLDAANDDDTDETMEVQESAAIRGFDLLAHAAEKSMDMMTRYAGKQYDPVEMMRATKEMMAGDNKGIELIVGALKEQGSQILALAQENQKLVRESMTPKETGPTKTLLEQLTEIKQFSELLGWGPRDDEPAPAQAVVNRPPPAKDFGTVITENIVPIVSGLSMIMAMGANIFYNMKASQPRNPAEDMAAAAKLNPMAQMQQQPGQVPGMPLQQHPPQPQPTDPLQIFRPFVAAIADAFLNHFFGGEGFDGHSFAEYILSERTGATFTPAGRQAYSRVCNELGRVRFEQLLQDHDSIWQKVRGMPQQLKRFLDEFFEYDAWTKTENNGKAAA